jgi:hypothetical protein
LGQTMLSNSGLCPPLNNIILKDPSFLFSVIENFKCMQMQREHHTLYRATTSPRLGRICTLWLVVFHPRLHSFQGCSRANLRPHVISSLSMSNINIKIQNTS